MVPFSVAGKDVVPRVGLHQLETLRHDLMDAIKRSKKNKVSFQLSRRNGDILGYTARMPGSRKDLR